MYNSGPSVLLRWASNTAPRLCPLIEDTSALEEFPLLEACADMLTTVWCCLARDLSNDRLIF